jgi:hypothetical protein
LKTVSKVIINTDLLHYPIGYMAGVFLTVYGYREIGNRAIPNIMIAFAMPQKRTAVFSQFFSYSAITPPRQPDQP